MRMQSWRFGVVVGALALAIAGAAWAAVAPEPTVEGIPNFHRVTERIYRGGQPEDSAWPELARLGVRTVLDLRRPGEHSTSAESVAVSAAGMKYVNFPMNGFATPTATGLMTPLSLLDGADPVFVHCHQGRDRTGTVVAAYRISRQNWENEKALAEACDLGLHWYERGMKRFIMKYRPADAGVPPPSDPGRRATPDSTKPGTSR